MRKILLSRVTLSLLLLAAIIVEITLNIPKPTTIPESRITTPTKRVNPLCVVSHLEKLSNNDLTRQLALMQQAGITRTRFDFNMITIEPSQGNFVWEQYDNIVNTAALYRITVIADIEQYNTPSWANDNQGLMYAPSPSIYHDYAQAIASHYKGKISLFEMGNEPNLSKFWPPKASSSAYSAFLKAGYNGVKAANPEAKVITGGLVQATGSNNPVSFVTRMYAVGTKGYFDYLGIHPYSQPNGPDFSSQDLATPSFDIVSELKNLMEQEGDPNKQIIITETGWPTTSDFSRGGVTPTDQASYILQVYTKIMYGSYQYIPIACIYNLINDGTDTTYDQDNFGLLNYDYTKKPAYTSIQMAASSFSSNFIAKSP